MDASTATEKDAMIPSSHEKDATQTEIATTVTAADDENVTEEADGIAAKLTSILVEGFINKQGRSPTDEEIGLLLSELTEERYYCMTRIVKIGSPTPTYPFRLAVLLGEREATDEAPASADEEGGCEDEVEEEAEAEGEGGGDGEGEGEEEKAAEPAADVAASSSSSIKVADAEAIVNTKENKRNLENVDEAVDAAVEDKRIRVT